MANWKCDLYEQLSEMISKNYYDKFSDSKIKKRCDFHKSSSWSFDRNLFKIAKENVEIKPSVMPFMYLVTFALELKSLEWFFKCQRDEKIFELTLGNNTVYSDQELIEARLYQFYAGFIRELRFMSSLFEVFSDIKVKKSYYRDLNHGVDFDVTLRGQEIPIGIRKEGRSSDEYDHRRKNKKKINGLVILNTRGSLQDQGIHLISREEITNKLGVL